MRKYANLSEMSKGILDTKICNMLIETYFIGE